MPPAPLDACKHTPYNESSVHVTYIVLHIYPISLVPAEPSPKFLLRITITLSLPTHENPHPLTPNCATRFTPHRSVPATIQPSIPRPTHHIHRIPHVMTLVQKSQSEITPQKKREIHIQKRCSISSAHKAMPSSHASTTTVTATNPHQHPPSPHRPKCPS